jgi:hypothetical protein
VIQPTLVACSRVFGQQAEAALDAAEQRIAEQGADDSLPLADAVRQDLARLGAEAPLDTDTDINSHASPVDIAGEESINSVAKVFMVNGERISEAGQELAMTTAPVQYMWVAHAGDLITFVGLILVAGAEALSKVIP